MNMNLTEEPTRNVSGKWQPAHILENALRRTCGVDDRPRQAIKAVQHKTHTTERAELLGLLGEETGYPSLI